MVSWFVLWSTIVVVYKECVIFRILLLTNTPLYTHTPHPSIPIPVHAYILIYPFIHVSMHTYRHIPPRPLAPNMGDSSSELIAAAWEGDTETVQLLLTMPGINVNFHYGISALIWAAFNGSTEIMQMLLAVPDINVNMQDQDGWCALTYAAHEGHLETMQLLLAMPEIDGQGLSRE